MELSAKNPREGWDARALEASESGRARSLREMLLEGGVDIREGVDAALLAQERTLRNQINHAAQRQVEIWKDAQGAKQAEAVSREIRALSTQLQEIQEQIRKTSPRYAALMYPQAANVAAMQKVLDPDTTLLEYALGDERSYLWIVTSRQLWSCELPPRREIEAAARRVYELLAAAPRGRAQPG